MRQELNGVKTAVSALGVQVNALQTDVATLKTDVSTLGEKMSAFSAFATETSSRLGRLETITHNTAIVVTGLAEDSVLIKKQLAKLDELDGLKKCLEVFTSEILASRRERTLAGKSFSDQQATLTDHELRLTRIELRGKQS